MTYLNLCWHFHQPYYLPPDTNVLESSIITFRTLYNYYPMALLIKKNRAKITCNLTPTLILQIQKIANGEIIDGFQQMLLDDTYDADRIKIFLDEIPAKIKERNNILQRLINQFQTETISKNGLFDLRMWMHLSCIHPILLSGEPFLSELLEKAVGFNQNDRDMLIKYEKKIFNETLPLFKELFESGNIEISTSPYYHPIMPLICDISVALTTKTTLEIPKIDFAYPDDVRQHLKLGLDLVNSVFGKDVKGIWPSEGSISNQVLDILSEYNINWVGADQQIISGGSDDISSTIHTWKNSFMVLFRNHEFSDRIGFIYQSWDEKNAALDLVKSIEQFSGGRENILTIILDGENPWEWYRNEGRIFLNEFYQRVIASPNIKMLTSSEIKNLSFPRKELSNIPAGSWMGLHFDNWIGKPDANRLWQILADARKMVQQYSEDSAVYSQLMEHILMAEGSDFFWWMSVPADQPTRIKFYSLFQNIISSIYKKAGLEIPSGIMEGISKAEILKQPGGFISPMIDGKITNFFEWLNACEIEIGSLWTTFQPFQLPVKRIAYGYDEKNFYIRLDIGQKDFSSINIEFKNGQFFLFDCSQAVSENIAIDECIEIKIPWENIGESESIDFSIRIAYKNFEIVIPPAGFFAFTRKYFEEDWQV